MLKKPFFSPAHPDAPRRIFPKLRSRLDSILNVPLRLRRRKGLPYSDAFYWRMIRG